MTRTVFVAVVVALVAAVAVFPTGGEALLHDLKLRHDSRSWAFIENFGFVEGGHLNLTVSNLQLHHMAGHGNDEENTPASYSKKLGFLIIRSETDTSSVLAEKMNEHQCALFRSHDPVTEFVVDVENWEHFNYDATIEADREGFYNVFMVNCVGFSSLDFDLVLDMYNVGSDGRKMYLDAGEAPLPSIYFTVFMLYLVFVGVWLVGFMRGAKRVLRIHYLITLLLVLKSISLLFKALEMRYQNETGTPGSIAIPYFIFSSLKGIMAFVVIALIGTGWSVIKPFLSDNDKKVFAVLVTLQIVDNIALIILEESAPGSQEWMTWKQVFSLVDVVCCAALLMPVLWSLQHLREAASTDGKAARNLERLSLFQMYYLSIVSYVYFTRIVVLILNATLSFKYIYVSFLLTELATFAFWATTCYRFRPEEANPYLSLASKKDDDLVGDDDDDDDDDGGIEMQRMEAGGAVRR